MSFAIMRFEKLKTGAPISGSVSHITRTRKTPNADPARAAQNRSIVGPERWNDSKGIHAAIEARTPEKYRKDAVRVLEFVITASPDWFDDNADQTDEYFDSAVEWLKGHFGAENVVCAVQHNDELTPHMHAYVVPLDDSSGKQKLSAKRWVGGRAKLRDMQTGFANHMSDFGVERGKARPGRKHKPQAEWYAEQGTLDDREAALKAREEVLEQQAGVAMAAAAQERREAEALATRAAEDRRVTELVSQTLEGREAAVKQEAQRLAILERELRERGDEIERSEAELAQRQAEIERAGEKLQQRLLAARESQATWEARRDQWLAENRPADVPPEVEKLRALDDMTPSAAADFLAQAENDSMHEFFDALAGPTPAGRALLDQHADAAAAAEGWKDAGLEGQSDGPKI